VDDVVAASYPAEVDVPAEAFLTSLAPVLQTALDAVVVMREDGTIGGWNEVAENIFGWARSDAIGKQLSDLIIPHRYREAHQRGLEAYFATDEGPLLGRLVEITALRASGDEFPIELSITPATDAGEQVFLGFLRDISERKAAEAALRESEARLSATYNHALVGIAEVDRSGRFLRANEQFSVMTGYSLDELRGMTFFDITHPGDLASEREVFDEHWRGRDAYTVEKRYIRKDGAAIWVELAASIVRGDDGGDYGVRIVRDITDEKRAKEQQRLLLHELNHRVKNTLTVVQGLAHQTFKSGAVPPELLRSFEGRLGALAAAHNLLLKQTWEATPIIDAAEAALKPFQTANSRISLDGPAILLTPSATVTLTLALHELATNAAKYGALSNDDGTIEARWTTQADMLTFVWREHGGPPVAPPVKTGFGTRLLQRTIASDLGGTVSIDFAPDGLVCTIVSPLNQTTP
jgi:PAS domain S-box-containing protein